MSTHTHSFDEVLSTEDGLTKRCRCGARLWEPDATLFNTNVSNPAKQFIQNLIRHIENSRAQTHIWHDGDRQSRPIQMSIQEPEVPVILAELRRALMREEDVYQEAAP